MRRGALQPEKKRKQRELRGDAVRRLVVLPHIWHQENRFSRNGHYKPILTRHGGVLPTKA